MDKSPVTPTIHTPAPYTPYATFSDHLRSYAFGGSPIERRPPGWSLLFPKGASSLKLSEVIGNLIHCSVTVWGRVWATRVAGTKQGDQGEAMVRTQVARIQVNEYGGS